ncbi:MAG: RNA polymerase sigma factor [Planctomycetota bacterium]
MQQTLTGDRTAGHAFVDRMVCIPRFLRRLDRRYGSPLGDDVLSDLSQEVAARVWRDRSRFAGKSRLESWVFGYARRVYLEGLGSWKDQSGLHVALDEGSDQHVDPGARVADAVAVELDAQAILELVDELPARDAEVIREKLVEGAPFSAIARGRGEDINAVKTRYYRALDRIRSRLHDDPRERDSQR